MLVMFCCKNPFTLDEDETFDSLSCKVFQQTPGLLFTLLSNIDDYYQNSQAQGQGSHWPSITVDEQTLDWQQTTAQLLTTLRAFSSFRHLCRYCRKTLRSNICTRQMLLTPFQCWAGHTG